MTRTAGGAVDLTGGKAGVGGREPNMDRAQFRRLTGAAQWGLAARFFKQRRVGKAKRAHHFSLHEMVGTALMVRVLAV